MRNEMTPYCFYLELVSKLTKVLGLFFYETLDILFKL